MLPRTLFLVALVGSLSFWAGTHWATPAAAPEDLASAILRRADARLASGDWGKIQIYTPDDTPTFGTVSMLTAELEFLPGQQLQPPHQHADEEFQYIIEGTGTWTLNGEEIPIQPGDLMYSKPWDWHGLKNTGEVPLRFFVVKWRSKEAGD
ncbi:cupin domain-containing protein [Synoicihabitans lomoniglobus]|uniref:Cupin domain-containing protein n=1 Tax=Synoicihabitans lomoniglobus TaxID=2909285 RepID=A0AAE9ZWH8_9BACT|nr:cupin domain-containing protein [Opitutaceae bacterium LMO-M01]WED64479.1 cupin domain-containing protein [Opitutaceae bacterium LMO-M01]